MAKFTPDEFAKHLNEAIKATLNALPEIIDTQANDAKALIKERIKQKGYGVNESGQEIAFKPYSKNKLPLYFFENSGTKTSQKKLKQKKIKGEPNPYKDGISYEEWRVLNGKQVDHRDLIFTGEMFRRLDIVNRNKSEKGYTVTVGGIDESTDNKLEWNSKSNGIGNVLRLSKQEEKTLAEVTEQEIIETFKKFLG